MIRSFPLHLYPVEYFVLLHGASPLPPGERVGHSSPQQSWGVFWHILINSTNLSRLPCNEYVRGEMRPVECEHYSIGTCPVECGNYYMGSLFYWDSTNPMNPMNPFSLETKA